MKFSLSSLFVSILMVSILTIILSLLMRNEKLYKYLRTDFFTVLMIVIILRLCLPFELPFTVALKAAFPMNYISEFSWKELIPGIDIETVLIFIWFTGAVVLIIRYLYKTNCFNLKIETIIKKSEAYENDRYRNDINKYRISIYTGGLIEYPMTVRDTVILIPESLINDDNFDNILKHEIQHVKNHDLFLKKAINIICCIFWWFVPVYIIRKYFDILLEMRVDNEVTRNKDIGEYARSLIDVKKKILTDKMNKGLSVSMISEDSRTLEYRIKYLFAGNFKKRTSTLLLMIVLLLPFATNAVIFEPAFPSPYDNEPNVYDENEIKEKAYIVRHKNGTYGLMIDGNYAQLENIEAEPFCHLRVVYED